MNRAAILCALLTVACAVELRRIWHEMAEVFGCQEV